MVKAQHGSTLRTNPTAHGSDGISQKLQTDESIGSCAGCLFGMTDAQSEFNLALCTQMPVYEQVCLPLDRTPTFPAALGRCSAIIPEIFCNSEFHGRSCVAIPDVRDRILTHSRTVPPTPASGKEAAGSSEIFSFREGAPAEEPGFFTM